VLNNDSKILSIAQHFTISGIFGGNNWQPTAKITTFDLQKKKLLTYKDFGVTQESIPLFNRNMEIYFANYLKGRTGSKKAANITADEEWWNLELGISNGNIVVARTAQPDSHSTYATYIIPVAKWNK
jgi:hypothetical protein